MKYKICACVSLLALALPAQALAEDADQGSSYSGILVTATRASLAATEITSALTVLDKAALDRGQDMGVSEILLRTPSISLSRNGGYGTSTSLRIRGAEADHTVLIIDGVKLNDPSATGGGYNFGHLLLGDIAQIEILRGPQSIMWGSQAIGGVVNIQTTLPSAPLEASFDLEAGSRETVNTRIGVGGQTGKLRWRIGAQSFITDGISAIAPEFGGMEKDGYRNRNIAGRGALDLTDAISIDFGGYYGKSRVHIDASSGDTPEYADNREWLAHAGLNLALADGRFHNRLTIQYTDTARENNNSLRARPLSFEAEGSNRRAEYQGRFHLDDRITLNFGADYEKSEFLSRSPSASLATPLPAFARGTAEIMGFYAQILASPIRNLRLDAGVRHDDHQNYGGATLLAAGLRYELPTGTVLRASYGEGFKAPTLFQLHSEYGNDSLSPEEAKSWEVGAEQNLLRGALKISANWFERTTKNQIVFTSCPPPPANPSDPYNPQCMVPGSSTEYRSAYYSNVARSKAHGVETEASLRLGALELAANYSWILSEDRSPGGANFGRWLPRRPRETANLSADYRTGFGASLGAAIRWSGKSYDNANNSRQLDGYELVDLRADMPLSPKLSIFGRAENIFDKNYMTAYRYGTLGRSFYAGLRGRF